MYTLFKLWNNIYLVNTSTHEVFQRIGKRKVAIKDTEVSLQVLIALKQQWDGDESPLYVQ